MNHREIAILNSRKTRLKLDLSQQMKLKKHDRNHEKIQDCYNRIQNLNKWMKQ